MAEAYRPGGDLVTDNAPSSRELRIMRAVSAIFLATIVVLMLLGIRSLSMWLSLVVALCILYLYWWGLRKPSGSS